MLGLEESMNVVERFTEGDCHILALEIKRIDPSFMLAVTYPGEDHAFVVKEGRALDIEGPRDITEFLDNWHSDDFMYVNEIYFDSYGWVGEYFAGSCEIARKVAKELVEDFNNV